MRGHQLLRLILLTVLSVSGLSARPLEAQVATRTTGERLGDAKDLLTAGRLTEAESAYAELLAENGVALSQRQRGEARFGRALARHRQIEAGALGSSSEVVSGVLDEYERAEQDAPERYRLSGANNRALLLRSVGQHLGAALAFESRARERPPAAGAGALIEAAREYLAVDRVQDARRVLREAIRLAPANPVPKVQLLELESKAGSSTEVVRLARDWRADSAFAPTLTPYLMRVMEGNWRQSSAADALRELAWNLVTRRATPSTFSVEVYERIRPVAQGTGGDEAGIVALSRAYRPPPNGLAEMPGAGWWERGDGADGFHAAWSATLRWLGEYHAERSPESPLARQYFAAALRTVNGNLPEWADRAAIEPLGFILTVGGAQTEGDRAALAAAVRRLEGRPSSAVPERRTAELSQIRSYHATSARVLMKDPAASRQLEAMHHVEQVQRISDSLVRRDPTRRLPVSRPLLEDLATQAAARGDADRAREIRLRLATDLERGGRTDEAGEVRTKMAITPPRPPDASDAAAVEQLSLGLRARQDSVRAYESERDKLLQSLREAGARGINRRQVDTWARELRTRDEAARPLMTFPDAEIVSRLSAEARRGDGRIRPESKEALRDALALSERQARELHRLAMELSTLRGAITAAKPER